VIIFAAGAVGILRIMPYSWAAIVCPIDDAPAYSLADQPDRAFTPPLAMILNNALANT
jgi:hypothetical protein